MLGHRPVTFVFAMIFAGMAATWQPAAAIGQTIDLSLNVFYTTPSNINSGGTWDLVAKASNFGLAGLEARLLNIATAMNVAPSGIVNGNDQAGFNLFVDQQFSNYRAIILGQTPILPLQSGEEQGAFYGVGQLANGSPDFPGKPVGSNSIGPTIASLTMPTGIPWGTGDALGNPAWSTAARLASGTFAAGTTPSFVFGSSGNVFTTTGSSSSFGTRVAATVSAIVRTNSTPSADYNQNGVVDAADYILWRHTLGQNVAPGTGADGSNNGIIDPADYNLWRANFGNTAASGASLYTNAIPEPGSASVLSLGLLLAWSSLRRTRPALRSETCCA